MQVQCHSRPVILCIDDHELGLRIRKKVLEKAGYVALIASTADKALQLFRASHVDLVLTEHVAPAMVDAPTIAATMKMLKPEVPVAILSADVQPSPEDRRFADAFIIKLVAVDDLLLIIKKLLMKRVARAVQLAA